MKGTIQAGVNERLASANLRRLSINGGGRLRVQVEDGYVATVNAVNSVAAWGVHTQTGESQAKSHSHFQGGYRRNLTVTP
ncbi:hypothetical protein [Deinococcus kurensis]|uniref:hypothetical protein n=1 Tax=Deinococcus kurensis TaxID=2662757 RepID=UPI0012D34A21|nr:hypothetical protein [Deinococcus kurensis]